MSDHRGAAVNERRKLTRIQRVQPGRHQRTRDSGEHVTGTVRGQPRRGLDLAGGNTARADDDRGRAFHQHGYVKSESQYP